MIRRWLAWWRADATQRDVVAALAAHRRQYPVGEGLDYPNIAFWIDYGVHRPPPGRFALWRAVRSLVGSGRLIVQEHPAQLQCAWEGGWYGVGHWLPGYRTYDLAEVPA